MFCNLEAPIPLNTVALLQPTFNSRPGPVFEYGNGVFQLASGGKYSLIPGNSPPYIPAPSSNSSTTFRRSNNEASHSSLTNDFFAIDTSNEAVPSNSEAVPSSSAPMMFDHRPGRTKYCNLEAPNPLITVELLQPPFNSRPGPVFENGEGVFQLANNGKYYSNILNSLPDTCAAFSHSLLYGPEEEEAFNTASLGVLAERTTSTTQTSPTDATAPHVASRPLLVSSHSNTSTTICAPHTTTLIAKERISVYYQNVRGLRTKIAQLRLLLTNCEYDILIFTETWLRADIESDEISSDYVFYRCDRSELTSHHSRGGGVLISVKKSLKCEHVLLENCDELEQVAVRIKNKFRSLYIVAIYLPPNSRAELYSAHARAVQLVVDRLSESDIILSVGDFNLPNLRWHMDEDVNGYIPSNISADTEQNFTDAMFVNGLRQINNLVNINERLLDLVFTNLPEYLDIVKPPSPLLPIDNHHQPFILLIDEDDVTALPDDQVDHYNFDFSACDFDHLNSILVDVEWEQLSSIDSVDNMVEAFYELLFGVITRYVPRKRQTTKSVYEKPWWTPELRNLRNNLRKLRNRYFLTKSELDRAILRDRDAEYKSVLTTTYENYILRVQSAVKQDPSRFWDFIKKRRSGCNIPQSVHYEGTSSDTRSEAANLFATFFESVFSKASPVQRQNCFEHIALHNIHLPCTQFAPDEVQKVLEDLDPAKGAGTDNIPPVLLKNCATSLASPIAAIFNHSLHDRIFPSAWKTASIVPIHKSGSVNAVSNYRGVSILCGLSKVLEKLLHATLYRSIAPIISDTQHGFMKHRSTTSNLMCYVTDISRELESKRQVDSVYIDFAKAFDTVPHNLIVDKLNHLGLPSWFTEWLYSYLSERKAFVKMYSTRSKTFEIPSGVPQGSVLGPLIFIIYVNDLYELLSSSKLSFADDLKFFRVINSSADCDAVQEDIDQLLVWCSDNGMRVNSKKCKVISYTRRNDTIHHHYNIGLDTLERVSSICDLGVTMDSRLRFNEHISSVSAKAFTVLGFLRRHASGFTDIYCLKTLYCSLVRSIIEYASPVWSPSYVTQNLSIERIQRRFIRFALRQLPWNDPENLPSYSDRCKLIALETLSARRIKQQRLFIFDLVTGQIECPELLNQIPWNVPPRRFRSSPLLAIPFHRTNYGFNNCFNVCLRSFNGVSDVFDFTLSKNVFSARIRDLD